MDGPDTNKDSNRVEARNVAERSPLFLKPHDQSTLAAVLGLAVICLTISTAWFAWSNGGVRDADDAPRNHAEFRVDLNTAPWHEIAMLPEIGEKTARLIVAHRQLHGPFHSVAGIDMVDGIGPHTLAAIRPFLAPLPASDTMVAELPAGALPRDDPQFPPPPTTGPR